MRQSVHGFLKQVQDAFFFRDFGVGCGWERRRPRLRSQHWNFAYVLPMLQDTITPEATHDDRTNCRHYELH